MEKKNDELENDKISYINIFLGFIFYSLLNFII